MVGRHYLPHRIHFVSLSFSLSTVMLALLLLRVLFFHFNLSFHLQFEKEMAKWNGVYNWCVQNVRIMLNESELTVWCAVLGVRCHQHLRLWLHAIPIRARKKGFCNIFFFICIMSTQLVQSSKWILPVVQTESTTTKKYKNVHTVPSIVRDAYLYIVDISCLPMGKQFCCWNVTINCHSFIHRPREYILNHDALKRLRFFN